MHNIYEKMASYNNTNYIVLDLIDFFVDDWKATRKRIKKINIYMCKALYWLKIGLL